MLLMLLFLQLVYSKIEPRSIHGKKGQWKADHFNLRFYKR